MIRQRIRFFGHVQGVGFRYTMSSLAKDLGLTGWVKNEYDGSVKSEVQGNIKDIDQLILLLRSDRYISIEYMERENLPVISGERSFKYSYY